MIEVGGLGRYKCGGVTDLEFGNSTVWDGTFATVELALSIVHETIKEEIDALIGEPSG